jgi:hypothetical protein
MVLPDTLDASPTLHSLQVAATYATQIPHIVSQVSVYTPSLSVSAYIRPEALNASPTVHVPGVNVSAVSVFTPLIAVGATVHTPVMPGEISVPTIPGSVLIYGPSVTLEAPLEIVGFNVGIRQSISVPVGIRTDLSQSLLLQNR